MKKENIWHQFVHQTFGGNLSQFFFSITPSDMKVVIVYKFFFIFNRFYLGYTQKKRKMLFGVCKNKGKK